MSKPEVFQSHSIPVQRTAHYYTIGQAGPAIEQLWIVCHGYGQLASNLIRKFSEFDSSKSLIVSPEALSRFYWKGFSGEVGASWMTRADRLDEIEDYCNYLQNIYDVFTRQLRPDVQINLLGFSQGCATQCRWIMEKQPAFHNLILWAGLLPDDLDYKPFKDYFKTKNLYWVYGTKDQFLTPERLDWQKKFCQRMLLDFKEITFDGKHEIDREVLIDLNTKLNDF